MTTIISTLGLLAIITGTFLPPLLTQKLLFALGSLLLLLASSLEKSRFFIVLQIIALLGTLVAFLPLTIITKIAMLLLASSIAIYYLFKQGMFQERINLLGCFGLLMLAIGYATSANLIYLLGGLALASYSYYSYRSGIKVAWFFMLLNIIFTITTIINYYRL